MSPRPRPLGRLLFGGTPAQACRVLLFALLVLPSCSTMGRGGEVLAPEVHVADLSVREAGLLEQRLRLVLRVANPNDFALPIDGLRFSLELNARDFATGLSRESLRIPRLSEERVEVDLTTSTLAVVTQLLSLGGRETFSYRLSGDAFVSGFRRTTLPFERSGEFRLTGTAAAPAWKFH